MWVAIILEFLLLALCQSFEPHGWMDIRSEHAREGVEGPGLPLGKTRSQCSPLCHYQLVFHLMKKPISYGSSSIQYSYSVYSLTSILPCPLHTTWICELSCILLACQVVRKGHANIGVDTEKYHRCAQAAVAARVVCRRRRNALLPTSGAQRIHIQYLACGTYFEFRWYSEQGRIRFG
jgi:hypothetical protein